MIKLVLAVAAVSLGSVTSAFADSMVAGWYVEAAAGVSLGEVKFDDNSIDDTAFIGRVNFGRSFDNNLRIGIEGSYSQALSKSGNVSGTAWEHKADIWSLMALGYYDFNNSTKFTPFVGAGLGLGIIDYESKSTFNHMNVDMSVEFSDTTIHVAGKLTAGVAYELNDKLHIIADYSLNYLHDAEFYDTFKSTYVSATHGPIGVSAALGPLDVSAIQNTFNLGLRYSF
ncbi:outer membrane protein [Flexibacterium corallicola]|uniref:outer membrane protein n=1 Tax=Flexibacterium corallicola TaxID=3037259 RepID=UPI00286F6CB7|nr:outer membrane beta-barrel protein [Pseudovibrio sp. M1P-2-3]